MNPQVTPEASVVVVAPVTPHPVQKPVSEFIVENIPQILRDTPLWGVWKYELRKGEKKWSKVPYRSIYTDELNSSSDVTKWSTFAEAMDAWSKHPELSGINFLIPKTTKDGIVGIDLDNCFTDAETLKPWAQEIVDQFPNNYIEISPSGKGLKFIIKADWRLKKHGATYTFPAVLDGDENDGKLEMFGHQIFTVTGNRFRNSPITISNGQEQLDHLMETYFTVEKQIDFSKYQEPVETGNLETDSANWIQATKIAYDSVKATTQWDCIDDIQVIEYLNNSIYDGEKFKQLMKGDASCARNDASRADLTLCNILARGCKGNAEQMDRIFRQSGLMREKWLRADYRHSTIGKAVLSYSEKQARKLALQSEPDEINGTIESLNQPVNTLMDTPVNPTIPSYKMTDAGNPVDIRDFISTMGKPKVKSAGTAIRTEFKGLREPIIDGLLRKGCIGGMIAPTKTGKSWFSLHLAFSVITGGTWLNLPCKKGKVLLLDNELCEETIQYRINELNKLIRYQLSDDNLNNMKYISLRGHRYDLNTIYDVLKEYKREEFSLIIIDAWYKMQPKGFDENSNGAATDSAHLIECYANLFKTAFMCVHHTVKGNNPGTELVDMGAGASANNRSRDSITGLKRHMEKNVYVLDHITRDFRDDILPSCWMLDKDQGMDLIEMKHLNPAHLKKNNNSSSQKEKPDYASICANFLTEKPKAVTDIIGDMNKLGLSAYAIRSMMKECVSEGYAVQTTKGKKLYYSVKPDFPETDD